VTTLEPVQYPRLATPLDVPRLLSGENVHHEWPPPGTSIVPTAHPEPWVLVVGTPSTGGADDWWVTDIATASGLAGADLLELLAQLAPKLSPVVAAAVAAGANYPVIYQPGEGLIVKWLRVTCRGTLGGGVEQFQFKTDWGNPGSDPTIDEATAADKATAFAGYWASAFAFNLGVPGTYAAMVASDVAFTEVGAVAWTQNTAKNADGTGGDAAQDYPTAWHAYPTGTKPTGTGGTALPYEVACAVTLGTDTRGPRGRGRLYLPPFGTSSMVTGGLFSTNAKTVAGEVIQKFFDLAKATETLVPIVVSMRAKQLHEVTSIQVGGVPDSQRRRRRSQAEAPLVAWTKP
jgi:hypothetical protein